MTDDERILREALAAGPTPGPWRHEAWGSRILDSGVGSSQLLIATVAVNTYRDQGRHNAEFIAACNPAAIRAMLDRLKAAEAEVGRLKCNAMQWRKPGPFTAEHPLDCLIVVPAIRQADGDWWLEGDVFLGPDSPVAWMPDTPEHRAMLDAAPTPPAQNDEVLEVLRELIAARDEFTGARDPQAIRSAAQRIRAAEKEARALLTKRGEA